MSFDEKRCALKRKICGYEKTKNSFNFKYSYEDCICSKYSVNS